MSYSTGTQHVSVVGTVSLDQFTLDRMPSCHASPCNAHALAGPIETGNSAICQQLQQVAAQLATMLATPEACRAAERYRWGWRAANVGRWAEAAEEFAAAISHYRFDARMHLAHAYALSEIGCLDDARSALTEAIAEGAISDHEVAARAVLMLAEQLEEASDTAAAQKVLRKASDDLPYCGEISAAAARLGDEQQAELVRSNAPSWTIQNAPELVPDEGVLPRDEQVVDSVVEAAMASFAALDVFAERPATDRWTQQALETIAAGWQQSFDRAASDTGLDDQLAALEAEIATKRSELEELRGTKVALRERKGHKQQIAQLEGDLVRLGEDEKTVRDRVEMRKNQHLPSAADAIRRLRDAPLREDAMGLTPLTQTLAALAPRPVG